MSLAAGQQWCPTSVRVTVFQARGLRAKGKSGTNDAYAVMAVGKEKYQTSVVEKSVAPMWREEATFDLPQLQQAGGGDTERSTLHVHVLHRALVGPDKLLGQAVIKLVQLSEDKTRNKSEWFKLLDKTGKADKDRGEVLVDIQFMRNNMTASMFDLSAAGKSRSRLGKFKDKVRGKKKESDVSTVVPSFTQVLTDSEEEGNGNGEVAAHKDEKKKKHKLKLFSTKSNLQRSISQSMSVLPAKNSSLSGSQSSGLNVDSSEGKKKFKFMIHKRSGSSGSKDSFSEQQKHGAAEQSNFCINGSHIYSEEPQPRTSRISSNVSLASSGHGSMEDVPGSSTPSVDSLRAVRHYSPWTEEDENMSDGENIKEDEGKLRREEEEMVAKERRRKEDEEERVRRQETQKLVEEQKRKREEERMRLEEERKLAEEMRRLEERKIEEERVQKEEGRIRRKEDEKIQEERRTQEEERREIDERVRKEEEERIRREEEERIQEEKRLQEEERRKIEEEKVRKEEEERIRREEEERILEERRKIEQKIRKDEEDRIRREEEERIWEERRKIEEQKIRKDEEERIRREEEERIKEERRILGEERRKIEEEKVRKEEEEIIRREEEERIQEERRQEEERQKIEEQKIRDEEERIEEERRVQEKEKRKIEVKIKQEEEERIMREERLQEEMRKQEEDEMLRQEECEENRRLEEQEKKLKEEVERKKKEEEEEKRKRIEAMEKIRALERVRVEEKRRRNEKDSVKRQREEQERLREEKRIAEEKKMRTEEKEKMQRDEDESVRKEERSAEVEEYETVEEKMRQDRIIENKFIEEEKGKRKEEKNIRREDKADEAKKLETKKKKTTNVEEQKEMENKVKHQVSGMKSEAERSAEVTAEVTSTNPFDENLSNNSWEESPDPPAGPPSAVKASLVQRGQSAESSPGGTAAFTDDKDPSSARREKRPAPLPPGRDRPLRQGEDDGSAQSNSRSKDIRTVSVLPQRSVQLLGPLSRPPALAENTQSVRESGDGKGTMHMAKPSKRPAPSRPHPVDVGPEGLSSDGEIPGDRGSETKREPLVCGLNPFEGDEDGSDVRAQDYASRTSSMQWPPAADDDAASQSKIKSSKNARAPLLPVTSSPSESQNTEGGHDGGAATTAGPRDPAEVKEALVQQSQATTVPGVEKTAGRVKAPPTASRRLQPVKPLIPLRRESVSVIQGERENKSTGFFNEVQEQTKVRDTAVKGPYSQLTQKELIALVLKQQNHLSDKNKRIAELEQYIDNLIVRVIEEKPSILMSMNSLK